MAGSNTAAPPVSLTNAVATLQRKRGTKPRARTQADIVADNADTISALVQQHGATQKEVAETLRELGEPVLDDGFAAEMRKQLGTMKEIRSDRTPASVGPASTTIIPSPNIDAQPCPRDEDFEENPFAARPPRR